MKLTHSFLRAALPHSEFESLGSPQECELTIDSRNVKPGNVFVAMQGSTTNGHQFLAQAVGNGARALIIEKKHESALSQLTQAQLQNTVVIKVTDTQQALFDMAAWWRKQFAYPVVGITGSVGKTTTKEMLGAILRKAKIPAFVSFKNQNSVTGLPMNILNMQPEHKMAVLEMGAHKIGDIGLFADIAQPTTALITNIAPAHAVYLGSVKEIAHQKKQIFKNFKADNIGIVFGDQPLLSDAYYPHPIIRFGLKTKNQIQARKIKMHQNAAGDYVTSMLLRAYDQEAMVTLPSVHMGRVYNALGAAALAHYLQVPFPAIVEALQEFKGVDGRFVMKKMKQNKGVIIDDCYNASPESVRAALMAFQNMKAEGRKIVVLGEMREQGEKEAFWHRQMGRVLSKLSSLDGVVFVGPLTKEMEKATSLSCKMVWVKDWQEAVPALNSLLDKDSSLVLVKASRGVRLENLINSFIE